PAKGAIVSVPRRYQPAGLAHPLHLAQRAHRGGQLLEHLMRVDDVERVGTGLERVEVADRELDVRTAAGVAACLLDHVGRRIDAEDASGCDPAADVSRDRAGAAPYVEHAGAGCEARREVGGRVVDRAPLVRPQYALVVAVCVGHGSSTNRAGGGLAIRLEILPDLLDDLRIDDAS